VGDSPAIDNSEKNGDPLLTSIVVDQPKIPLLKMRALGSGSDVARA